MPWPRIRPWTAAYFPLIDSLDLFDNTMIVEWATDSCTSIKNYLLHFYIFTQNKERKNIFAWLEINYMSSIPAATGTLYRSQSIHAPTMEIHNQPLQCSWSSWKNNPIVYNTPVWMLSSISSSQNTINSIHLITNCHSCKNGFIMLSVISWDHCLRSIFAFPGCIYLERPLLDLCRHSSQLH